MDVKTTASPIKDPPLRLPAQSSSEELKNLFDDKLLPWFLSATLSLALAAWEWLRFLIPNRPNPWLFSVIALVIIALFVWKLVGLRPRLRQLRQGIAGESRRPIFERIAWPSSVSRPRPGASASAPMNVFATMARADCRLIDPGPQPGRAGACTGKLAEAAHCRQHGATFAVFPVLLFPGWCIEQVPESRQSI